MRRVDGVVAAAAHPLKARAVRSVICSGILTDVVVDIELAHALLAMPRVARDEMYAARA